MLGRFLEAGDVHVTDAWADHEVQIDAVAGNLVANDAELERVIGTFAQHGDADGCALGPFEKIGHVGGAHVVGGFSVNGGDDVAGTNARAVGGRAGKGRDHDDFVIARADRHADAVILAALLFARVRIRLWIKEIRVRVELVQHARNGAVVDGFVGVHGVGVVLSTVSYTSVNCLKLSRTSESVLGVAGGDLLGKKHAKQAEQSEDENYQGRENERELPAMCRFEILGQAHGGYEPAPSERSIACGCACLLDANGR